MTLIIVEKPSYLDLSPHAILKNNSDNKAFLQAINLLYITRGCRILLRITQRGVKCFGIIMPHFLTFYVNVEHYKQLALSLLSVFFMAICLFSQKKNDKEIKLQPNYQCRIDKGKVYECNEYFFMLQAPLGPAFKMILQGNRGGRFITKVITLGALWALVVYTALQFRSIKLDVPMPHLNSRYLLQKR